MTAKAKTASYRFTGAYETLAQLPDASVRVVSPGDVLDFPADTHPGPMWVPVTTDTPAPATDGEPADVAAWLAEHPQTPTA